MSVGRSFKQRFTTSSKSEVSSDSRSWGQEACLSSPDYLDLVCFVNKNDGLVEKPVRHGPSGAEVWHLSSWDVFLWSQKIDSSVSRLCLSLGLSGRVSIYWQMNLGVVHFSVDTSGLFKKSDKRIVGNEGTSSLRNNWFSYSCFRQYCPQWTNIGTAGFLKIKCYYFNYWVFSWPWEHSVKTNQIT